MKSYCRTIGSVVGALLLAAGLYAQDNAQNPQENNNKPLAFHAAIELALKNSAATGLSQADSQRARATVAQSRDDFLPQMVIGSGLGFSYGFRLRLPGAAHAAFNGNC